jgi:hypothetical protein
VVDGAVGGVRPSPDFAVVRVLNVVNGRAGELHGGDAERRSSG